MCEFLLYKNTNKYIILRSDIFLNKVIDMKNMFFRLFNCEKSALLLFLVIGMQSFYAAELKKAPDTNSSSRLAKKSARVKFDTNHARLSLEHILLEIVKDYKEFILLFRRMVLPCYSIGEARFVYQDLKTNKNVPVDILEDVQALRRRFQLINASQRSRDKKKKLQSLREAGQVSDQLSRDRDLDKFQAAELLLNLSEAQTGGNE